MKPTISFVTGTRNRPDDLRRMIDSIEDHCPIEWELIIADASEIPVEEQEIATAEAWKRIRVMAERPPRGYTKGYNTALRAARGRYCIFLNDDCVIEPGIEAAAQFMEGHPEIGLGAIPYAEPGKPVYQIYSYMGLPYANFGILSHAFGNRIGWFDEDFPMYGSDNSLAFRVLLAGKGIAQVPKARIYHYATADSHRVENNNPEKRYREAALLNEKYGPLVPQMTETYLRICGKPAQLHDHAPNLYQG